MGLYRITITTNVTDLAGNPLTTDYGPLTFNLVPVDLELSDVAVSTNQLWANDPVTISWFGLITTSAPRLGIWTDAVYISRDTTWDIFDGKLATMLHTNGLAQDEGYSNSLSVFVPGVLAGNYHAIIRADIYNQEKEANNEADDVVSSGPLSLHVPAPVPIGPAVSGTLRAGSRAHYYAVGASAQWAPQPAFTMTNLWRSFTMSPTLQQQFYRAKRLGP